MFRIALVLFFLYSECSATIQDHCTDISYWDEIRYETSSKQCCDTKLHLVCSTKSDQICKDVLELQCEVVAWGECHSKPTNTRNTVKCGIKYNDFAHQNCEEVTTSITHTKKVPECKLITKNNCVTDWEVDDNGNKVWAGSETCTPVTWEECDIVEKTVQFPTVKTQCHVDSQIKWVEFVDTPTNIVGFESKCEVKKAVNCKHVVLNKCAPVVWRECTMEPREECRAFVIHTPIQEKIHQKKCLTGDNTANLNQIQPRNQLLQNHDLTSVEAARANIDDAIEMNNIGKLFSGYDIMKGNPLPVEPFPVDPGFRQPIFNASYQSGSLTADRRYLQPDGTTIASCNGGCLLTFGSTEISGSKSYQESLARKVGLSVGGSAGVWEGKFSASVGYKDVEEKTSSESNLFTISSASCCAYTAELLSFKLPSLSQNFLFGVGTLTEKYDETIYLNFINAFGTHFIRQARMGALYGEQTEISQEAWATMLEKEIDISTAAEISAYGVTAAADYSQTDNGKKAKEFSSIAENQKTFTIGVKPPGDGKKETWLEQAISDPAPIELQLGGSLLYLLEQHNDIKANVSTAVKANLKKAMDNYCSFLLKSGEAKTCSLPGADPPFPSRRSDKLYKGQKLNAGEFLRSDNGAYRFVIEEDGNMVIYRILNSGRRATWESDTKQAGPGSVFVFEEDGNLVLWNNLEKSFLFWESRTAYFHLLIDKTTAEALVITDDGVLELQSTTGEVLWASNQEYVETSGIDLDALTNWGSWGQVVKCSFPHFVNEMEIKYETRSIWQDDSALNAIRLTCTDGRRISSSEGRWGSWRSPSKCPEGEFINEARIRSEAPTDGDNTAANGIRFKCTGGGSQHEPFEGDWGSWQPWKSCQPGSAIYGIQTLVQSPIDGDDTALNNVKFFCANLPETG